jgi:DNA-binding CsgD family transcriptional regulator
MTHFIPPRLPVGPSASITKRQAEVLHLMCQGLTNRRIGDRLNITEDTVKATVRRILAQLGATDRAHATALVYSGLTVEIRDVHNRWSGAA